MLLVHGNFEVTGLIYSLETRERDMQLVREGLYIFLVSRQKKIAGKENEKENLVIVIIYVILS
jgi:hypothetical protein